VIPSDFGTQYSFHKTRLTGLLGSEEKINNPFDQSDTTQSVNAQMDRQHSPAMQYSQMYTENKQDNQSMPPPCGDIITQLTSNCSIT